MKVLLLSLGLLVSGQGVSGQGVSGQGVSGQDVPAVTGLTPFLVGTSHPEIPRQAPTPTELKALRGRVLGLLYLPHPPGVNETKDWADELQGALTRRELGYIDAAFAVTRVRDTLSIKHLTETIIKDVAEDMHGRFADTPLKDGSRRKILRGLREVLGSARNELP